MNRKTADVLARIFFAVIGALLLIVAVSFIYPIFWMIINSFKDEFDYGMNLFNFPTKWMWSNYIEVVKFIKIEKTVVGQGTRYIYLGEMIYNTLFRCIVENFIGLYFTVTCAYALARFEFPGKKFIYKLCIVIMIVPIIGNMPSALQVHKALGTYDNMYTRLIGAPATIFSMNYLILYGAFKALPQAYSEAAEIDGAGRFTVMMKIMIPMQMPLCVTFFVLNFLGIWNDYATSLVYLPSYPNLAYALYQFRESSTSGASGATSAMILAGYALIMVPTALLYLACHKFINSKIVVGGLKG